ncbi:MAG TPA: hypothetical protein VJZ27_04810 [Aggregatilineales bacterium]|nr:hypothetical protein [Aggregatilineales bacterium]
MDVLMIVLRLIHIFAGIFWIGVAMFMVGFVAPTVQKLGADGGKFMQGLVVHTPYGAAMGITATSTFLTGAIMFYKTSDSFNGDWLSTTQGIVLSIGVVAGTLAWGHGAATLAPRVTRIKTFAEEISRQGGVPTAEQVTGLQTVGEEIGTHSRISLVIAVVAVFCMASFRYF